MSWETSFDLLKKKKKKKKKITQNCDLDHRKLEMCVYSIIGSYKFDDQLIML